MNKTPLVSIVIITYNSAPYILETLESIKIQTYKNLELIITDDCSIDNTVDICNEWLNINKHNFTQTALLTVNLNTGVSGNCNRGVKYSTGKWVKVLAGDDIFYPNAIEDYVAFLDKSTNHICCSQLELFGEDNLTVEEAEPTYNRYYTQLSMSLKAQQKLLRKQLFIPGPGVFFSRYIYDLVRGFDERFPMGEEWPFYLKITEAGYPILMLHKKLVKYRINSKSLCRGHNFGISKSVFDNTKDFFFKVRIKIMIRHFMFLTVWNQALGYKYLSMQYNNRSPISLNLFRLIFFLNPLFVFAKCKNILFATKR